MALVGTAATLGILAAAAVPRINELGRVAQILREGETTAYGLAHVTVDSVADEEIALVTIPIGATLGLGRALLDDADLRAVLVRGNTPGATYVDVNAMPYEVAHTYPVPLRPDLVCVVTHGNGWFYVSRSRWESVR